MSGALESAALTGFLCAPAAGPRALGGDAAVQLRLVQQRLHIHPPYKSNLKVRMGTPERGCVRVLAVRRKEPALQGEPITLAPTRLM